MKKVASVKAKVFKGGLTALAAAVLSLPLANAVATPVDPTLVPAQAELSAEQVETGRQIFNDWSCSACHVLTDAGGNGHIGPSLDGNDVMDKDFLVSRITNGQGAMPGFGGQLTDEEIDLLSEYILQAKK